MLFENIIIDMFFWFDFFLLVKQEDNKVVVVVVFVIVVCLLIIVIVIIVMKCRKFYCKKLQEKIYGEFREGVFNKLFDGFIYVYNFMYNMCDFDDVII